MTAVHGNAAEIQKKKKKDRLQRIDLEPAVKIYISCTL